MAAEYRLVSYADGGAAKAGVLIGDRVVPAATLLAATAARAADVVLVLRRLTSPIPSSRVAHWPWTHRVIGRSPSRGPASPPRARSPIG